MDFKRYIEVPFFSQGRSFFGADCWGLCYLFYKHELGIVLPQLSNEYDSVRNSEKIAQIIAEQKVAWRKIDNPLPSHIVVLRLAGRETHVGLYMGRNRMLHTQEGTNSCQENLRNSRWKNRIAGFYAYAP